MTYQPIPIETEGTRKEAKVADNDVSSILLQILEVLQRIEVHFQTITDEEVENEDIGDE